MAEIDELRERLAAAERVCLMAGWTPEDPVSERGKALYELWSAWDDRYGADAVRRHRADLSDEYIAELARKRDATRAATLAHLGLTET